MRMIIGNPRRDGKYPVKLVYSNGKVLNKLFTYAQIESEIAAAQKLGLTVDVYK